MLLNYGRIEVRSAAWPSQHGSGLAPKCLCIASIHVVPAKHPVLRRAYEHYLGRSPPKSNAQQRASAGYHCRRSRGAGVPRAAPGRLDRSLRCCVCAPGRQRCRAREPHHPRRSHYRHRPLPSTDPTCDYTESALTTSCGTRNARVHVLIYGLCHADLACCVFSQVVAKT